MGAGHRNSSIELADGQTTAAGKHPLARELFQLRQSGAFLGEQACALSPSHYMSLVSRPVRLALCARHRP